MSLADKIKSNGPKKILALDGGGIRGILTVEVLAKIENMLRQKLARGLCSLIISIFSRGLAPARSSPPAFPGA